MSKPRDPILVVLNYFETADVPLARQALSLAQAIVRRRQPKVPAKPAARKRNIDGPGPREQVG
jgi:hypothetical protein